MLLGQKNSLVGNQRLQIKEVFQSGVDESRFGSLEQVGGGGGASHGKH